MSFVTEPTAVKKWNGPGMGEFVAIIAAIMAVNALAIDVMLPALPAIGEALGVAEENRRQLVITAYLIGFGTAQIFYGPISDRVGRKPVLVVGLLFFGLFAVISGLVTSFSALLFARLMQGIAAASTRVLVVSVVRDRFQGSAMAQVMSLVMIIFMVVPMAAPGLGQVVLWIADWRSIFITLGVYGISVLAWATIRLPETLPRQRRIPLSFRTVARGLVTTLRTRSSLGNTLALMLIMGGLFGYINSIQQIVFDVYGRPEMVAVVFAIITIPMAASSYVNSRIVRRFGAKRILLLALCGFVTCSAFHLAWSLAFDEGLWTFVALQCLTMGCFGLIGANLGAMAMEELGHIAGTASSIQGLITTVGGALVGLAVGQAFDGTIIPFLVGLISCGLLGLVFALWGNRGKAAEDPVL